MHDAGVPDIPASCEMPGVGPVQEGSPRGFGAVFLLEVHVLLVHVRAVGEELEGFPEHGVPPVDLPGGQRVAFRLADPEGNAHAAAAGQDGSLSVLTAYNVKYAVCLFRFHSVPFL